MSLPAIKVLTCLGVLWLAAGQAQAISHIRLSIGHAKAADWQVEKLGFNLRQSGASQYALLLTAGKAVYSADKQMQFDRLQIECVDLAWHQQISCEGGDVQFYQPLQAGLTQARWRGSYQPVDSAYEVDLNNISRAGGSLSATLSGQDKYLQAQVSLADIDLAAGQLQAYLATLLPSAVQGKLSGKLQLHRQQRAGQPLTDVSADLSFSGLSWVSESGESLIDAIDVNLQAQMSHRPAEDYAYRLDQLEVRVPGGELLTPYFYSDFSRQPLSLKLDSLAVNSAAQWRLAAMHLSDDLINLKAFKLQGQASLISDMQLELAPLQMGQAYDFYLAPLLVSDLARIDLNGQVSLELDWQKQSLAGYNLKVTNASVRHLAQAPQKPRFSAAGIELLLSTTLPQQSHLALRQASLLDTLQFGHTDLPLRVEPGRISLRETTSLPLFDGELMIEKLSIDHSKTTPQVEFQGLLTPVSLAMLSEAFGWPQMSGRISGIIPSVTYHDGSVKMAGTLLARVFDGDILIRQVNGRHLLSSWPVLSSEVEIRGIDLEKLTQTFSFGRITGRVDGSVKGLVLENWQPTRFDAQIRSSTEPGRRRISQKAVDNISNLGGSGMAGALSRSFMRFFEDFGYDELGFRCILRNGVCRMSGVDEATEGYYLVKGGGIPRIDVIGHNRNTDWQELLDRLASISTAGAPTVE